MCRWNAAPQAGVALFLGQQTPFSAVMRRGSLLQDLFSGPVNRIEIFRRWLPAWVRKHRVHRFFALAFPLEEMRRTFRDLGHDVEVTAAAPEGD